MIIAIAQYNIRLIPMSLLVRKIVLPVYLHCDLILLSIALLYPFLNISVFCSHSFFTRTYTALIVPHGADKLCG